MTSIHARIPSNLKQAVDAARRRGEEAKEEQEQDHKSSMAADKDISASAQRIKSRPVSALLRRKIPSARPPPLPLTTDSAAGKNNELSDDEEDHDPCKENDPSQSPSPVLESPRSPRKNVLGKRPLSELPTPTDPEASMTESEKNIAVNQDTQASETLFSGPLKKSPRLAVATPGTNTSGRLRIEKAEDFCTNSLSALTKAPSAEEEKENFEQKDDQSLPEITKIPIRGPSSDTAALRPTLRKMSNMGSSKGKAQPRVGIRRL
jgi:ubiquitin-conjugating enzyme E2 S